jgi:hypothetical protein
MMIRLVIVKKQGKARCGSGRVIGRAAMAGVGSRQAERLASPVAYADQLRPLECWQLKANPSSLRAPIPSPDSRLGT